MTQHRKRINLTTPKYVNSAVDKLIYLLEIRAFEKVAKTTSVRYPVRVTKIYDAVNFDPDNPKDAVKTSEVIEKWAAAKGSSFKELMTSLRMLASTTNYIATNRIERTQLDPNIFEIKDCGQRLRLFAFIANEEIIIIAEHYQKHGRSPKEERQLQDRAIHKAIARRKLFIKATKVEEDFYQVTNRVRKK